MSAGSGSNVAAALLRQGRPLDAAGAFLELGQAARAAEALALGGLFEDAARLALQHGEPLLALQLAVRHGLLQLSSQALNVLLLGQGRSPSELARLVLGWGNSPLAAELFALAGEHARGSELLERSGAFSDAAAAARLSGDWARAARLWEAHLRIDPGDSEARLSLARHYLEGGREQESVRHAQALLRSGHSAREVERILEFCLERLGLGIAAGELRAARGEAPRGASAAGGLPDSLGRLGSYELLGLVGQGNSSQVFQGRELWTGRLVAIKRLRGGQSGQSEASGRFWLEARLASRLRHPWIVQVLHVEERLGFWVLEWLAGGTLRDWLQRSGEAPPHLARRWILEALSALEEAHFAGLIHRDLKPENLLLTEDGHLKVSDFGAAHVLDATWTRSGLVRGTYGYLAPEQLLGRDARPATDLYSIGVILYEMLCGRLPFSPRDLMQGPFEGSPAWPSLRGRRLHVSLGGVLLRLLSREPRDRFETAREAMLALEEARWEWEGAEALAPDLEMGPAPESRAPAVAAWPQERYRALEEPERSSLGWTRGLWDLWLDRPARELRPASAGACEEIADGLRRRGAVLLKVDPGAGLLRWLEPERAEPA